MHRYKRARLAPVGGMVGGRRKAVGSRDLGRAPALRDPPRATLRCESITRKDSIRGMPRSRTCGVHTEAALRSCSVSRIIGLQCIDGTEGHVTIRIRVGLLVARLHRWHVAEHFRTSRPVAEDIGVPGACKLHECRRRGRRRWQRRRRGRRRWQRRRRR